MTHANSFYLSLSLLAPSNLGSAWFSGEMCADSSILVFLLLLTQPVSAAGMYAKAPLQNMLLTIFGRGLVALTHIRVSTRSSLRVGHILLEMGQNADSTLTSRWIGDLKGEGTWGTHALLKHHLFLRAIVDPSQAQLGMRHQRTIAYAVASSKNTKRSCRHTSYMHQSATRIPNKICGLPLFRACCKSCLVRWSNDLSHVSHHADPCHEKYDSPEKRIGGLLFA